MNMNKILRITGMTAIMLFIILSGCYTIMSINQPMTVQVGQKFTAHLVVRTEPDPQWGLDDDPKNRIVSVEIPMDWVVDSVYFIGTEISPDTVACAFLPADQPDAYPSNVDFWTTELEDLYPTTMNMEWRTYQSVSPVVPFSQPEGDTTYNDLYINFTVGQAEGDVDLGYFVTDASLDFTDPNYFSISRGNTITITGASALRDEKLNPKQFYLAQNYPNPFNPSTDIRFSLNQNTEVSLNVYNSSGQVVRELLNGQKTAGIHTVHFEAFDLASGVYFYKLHAGENIQVRKMILMK